MEALNPYIQAFGLLAVGIEQYKATYNLETSSFYGLRSASPVQARNSMSSTVAIVSATLRNIRLPVKGTFGYTSPHEGLPCRDVS